MESKTDPLASTEEGAAEALVGEIIGEYRLTRAIGRGGMGVVYSAEHARLGSPAAVKLLAPEHGRDRRTLSRFFAEARAVAALDHPAVARVIDLIEGERPAIVMELLRGRTLAARLADGPLPPAQVAGLLKQLLACLVVVHRRGIVHRDLKPSNLFLVEDQALEGGLRLKVLDFGVAKFVDAERYGLTTSTGSGLLVGTPQYMSPEQIEGRPLDGRTDLYAVGCIAFEALSGAPPFRAPTLTALMSKHLLEPPPALLVPPTGSRGGAGAELSRWILRCLAKAPADRWPSAEAALRRLDPTLAGDTLPGATRPEADGAGRRHGAPARWKWAALGAAAIAALVVGAVAWRNGAPRKAPEASPPPVARDASVLVATSVTTPDAAPAREPPVEARGEDCATNDAAACAQLDALCAAGESAAGEACAWLAYAYRARGRHVDAVDAAERACALGSAVGCRGLAVDLEHGKGTERDLARARQVRAKACRLGDKDSCAR